jgi:phage shock protein A
VRLVFIYFRYPRETNFMDLPAEMRQNLEALEKAIQAHADAARPFSNRVDPSGKLQQIEEKLTLLEEKIAAYTCLHSQQHARATAVKKATSMHWRYAESVARTIEASRGKETPGGLASGGSQMHWQRAFAPTDPTSEHFEEVIGEMETQLTLTEGIAEALRKQIEPLLSNDAERDATEAIRLVLSHEGETLAALTRRYSHLQDEVEGMRKRFRTFCAKYRNDSRDPFASKFDYDTRNHVALAAPAASSLAPLLPSQPVASVSQQMPSSSTVLFGSAPSSTSQLLPSATTALAPMKPAGSFGGFSFGQRP